MFSEIAAIAREYGCVFTLYVDDMTFSSSKPIQVNNDFIKTPYDNSISRFNNLILMNRNNINPMNGMNLINGINPINPMNPMNTLMNPYMRNVMYRGAGQNTNMNMTMYQNMMGIYDPRIWSNGMNRNLNDGINYNCYNNYTKAQNSYKHNEKKFVDDCEF